MKEKVNRVWEVRLGEVVTVKTMRPTEAQRIALKSAGFRFSSPDTWMKKVSTREDAIEAGRQLVAIFPRDAALLMSGRGRAEGKAYIERCGWIGRVAESTQVLEGGLIGGWTIADNVDELYG